MLFRVASPVGVVGVEPGWADEKNKIKKIKKIKCFYRVGCPPKGWHPFVIKNFMLVVVAKSK